MQTHTSATATISFLAGLAKQAAHVIFDCAGRAYPAEPTDAPPGSAAKLLILADRAERGESLCHPKDASLDLNGGTAWLFVVRKNGTPERSEAVSLRWTDRPKPHTSVRPWEGGGL
jgi:hypothetical protein